MVPLLDIKAQNEPLRADLLAALARVVDSGAFILGPECEALEKDLAEFTGTKHGVGMSSGTDALLVALMALDVGPGDEVLVPAFTFFATAGCVARLGATPVFVDSRPEDYNMDPQDLERKITSRSKVVVPVHLFGQTAPMEAILDIARKHELAVVEDSAQALGATDPLGPACSMGDIGITSFYPTKNLGALGDAGMLFTSDDGLADKCRKLRNHGMAPRYYHAMVGGNFRLDGMQAAMLRVKLPHLRHYADKRKEHAEAYNERLSQRSDVAQSNEQTDGARLVLPQALPGMGHVWNQYTIRVTGGQRDALRSHLAEKKIGSEVYYPLTLDMQACFAEGASGGDSCATAHQLAEEVLSLPVYAEMSDEQLGTVCDALESFLDS